MSIVALVNLKAREGAPPWLAFHSAPERFGTFFARLLDLPAERPRTRFGAAAAYEARAAWATFLVHVFASLEDAMLRPHALRLVSLPMWETLTPTHLQQLLAAQPQLAKPWKGLSKRRDKEAKMASPPASSRHEREFIPGLLRAFLRALAVAGGEATDELALPTRRFFHAVVLDTHVLERAAISAFAASGAPETALFAQLLALARTYESYDIDDHRGVPLSEAEVKTARSEQLQALQRVAFRMEGLQDFALSNLSAIDSAASLGSHFGRLSLAQLRGIALRLGLVHDAATTDGADADASSATSGAYTKPFLIRLLVSRYERRTAQHELIGQLPLYPDEITPWDVGVVPDRDYHGDSCLALPKLNLQFLTLHDYLLRNFSLFRLEATHEIKEDLEDVCERLRPRRQLTGKTVFRGWARMALPLVDFKLYKVGRPHLGENKPSEVRAEATVSLAGCRPEVAAEWNALRKHDVVFLLTLEATVEEGGAPSADASAAPFPQRVGLVCVRGAEVAHVADEEGNVFTGESETDRELRGKTRKLSLSLDTAQYHLDALAQAQGRRSDVYQHFNVLVRRKPKENNFKAILECIRDLMTTPLVVPEWLQDVLLGYGDPAGAAYWNLPADQRVTQYDFFDTFVSIEHVLAFGEGAAGAAEEEGSARPLILVQPYEALVAGPYPEDLPRMNTTRFTPQQVEALRAAMNPGLSVVVGPPGTGKTDTAVQIVSNLVHTFPSQRLLIITHSNQALNDVFEKLMTRHIDERYLLRLGHGEELLETEKDFSRLGRVNHMLTRRLELLVKVERLATSLEVAADVGYTCETAQYFFHSHVLARWEAFGAAAAKREAEGAAVVALLFPFADYFADAPPPLFRAASYADDMRVARGCFTHLQSLFTELEECRAFEILRSSHDRGNFLLTKHAKVIAMTCTHAAIKRKDLINLGFQFDSLVMEEAAQILEVETFIPIVLQNPDAATGKSRLKRVVLLGDHHQLPPVVKNAAFQKYSRLDQSLFARFVRLGVPATTLDMQGRARPGLANLYRWRYAALKDLPRVTGTDGAFALANGGFAYDFQFVDVGELNGVGESSPSPFYIQNLAEAEYCVAVFMYMRLQGIAASRISIITTYNGQRDLIADVVQQRCAWSSVFGSPAKIATTDKFQGQQNDFILLSLVRTKSVGHLRDVRRLVVAMSRARLGMYVFGRRELFEPCVELSPTFAQLLARPDALTLLPAERHPTMRRVDDVPNSGTLVVKDVVEMGALVTALAQRAEAERNARADVGNGYDGAYGEDVEMSAVMSGGATAPSVKLAVASPLGRGPAQPHDMPEAPPELEEED
ncbi:intron-binding protein aquarius [Chrysochromulina tobinii]|uniref:Intron-binding protein aquarius n=1 Tax=Chrysochromulina tobinii TaxID=1460289 RepID=A0A0M0JQE7_9EUKA|nr:intron-binding protein aquarius [Chrysochromulina tobinii]|eukprot:KOO28512.1 intron-binding protein aquarius [Chrysochromulina sp. CCMP291]